MHLLQKKKTFKKHGEKKTYFKPEFTAVKEDLNQVVELKCKVLNMV